MSTNPDDIHLSDEQRRRLAQLADERGTHASEIIAELIDSAETALGIRRGLDSAARGEGIAAKDLHDAVRNKFGL